MSRIFIFPWKMASTSARDLARAVGIRRIYPDRKYSPRSGDIILNWGNSKKPQWWGALIDKAGTTIINHPDHVKAATDKLLAFKKMKEYGVSIPAFTDDRSEALVWLEEGQAVCARRVLNGYGAAGLSIHANPEVDDLPIAPLFTEYVKKKHEYRIHVFKDRIIDFTMKRLRNGIGDTVDYQIRNHDGGWIFARDGVNPPAEVLSEAKKAVAALGLQFGAVDIGWNQKFKRAVVYEVNSAPGLAGTTLYTYAKVFSEVFNLPLHIGKPENNFDDINLFDGTEFDMIEDGPVGIDPGLGQVDQINQDF